MIANLFIDREGRLRSGWRFLIALMTVFGGFFLSEILAAGISANVAVVNMINRPVSSGIMLIVFFWMAKVLDHATDPAAYIGLGTKRAWSRDLAFGCLLGATLVSACVAVIAIVGNYRLEAGAALTVSRGTAIAVVAWVFIFGALTEELALRSYPLYRLSEAVRNLAASLPWKATQDHSFAIGSWSAIVVLACLFGSLHFANPNFNVRGFGNTILIGIFFGVLMVRTGSLWLLWGLHFGWNFTLGALYGLPVSGINQFSVLWTGRAGGPTWLTGGAYGIEASATATVFILLALVVVIRLPEGAHAKTTSGIQNGVAGS